jgi:hypothetical protein
MQKSKLISILKKFDREEMKEFEKFISSPYFQKGRNLKPVFRIIKKYYPSYDSPKFTEEIFFRTLYPGKKFEKKSSSHTIHVHFSVLTRLAEKFMVYSSIEKGKYDYQYNIFLAESYRDRGIMDPVVKLLKKNSEILDKDESKLDFYKKRLENNMSLSGVFYTLNMHKESYEFSRKNLLYIYALIFDLTNKYVNEYFVNRYSYNFDYKGFELIKLFIEAFDPELFESKCEDDAFETRSLVLINYYIIKSRLNENDKKSLDIAFTIYTEIFNNLSRFVKWFNYVMLFNRFFGRIRYNRYYLNKANELIDFVWGKGIFSTHKKIKLHFSSFHSALMVKAALTESKAIYDFIVKYTNELDPEIAEPAKEYSFAILHFKNKEYDKAIKIVSRNDVLNFPSLKINKYKIKICCLIELSYPEEALLAIDSFEHYLRSNKYVSEIIKSENLKFSAGIKKIIKLQFKDDIESDIELKKIIEHTENSIYGYWFREKIQQMNQ